MAAFPRSQNNNPIGPSTDEQESTLTPNGDEEEQRNLSPEDAPRLAEQDSSSPRMQVYQVVVPQGVKPNDHFTVLASNYRVVLKCPPIMGDGRKVQFKIPIRRKTTSYSSKSSRMNTIHDIQLSPNSKKNLHQVVI